MVSSLALSSSHGSSRGCPVRPAWTWPKCYFRQVVVDDPEGPVPFARQVWVTGSVETAMGWEAYPAGLEQLLVAATETYAPGPIFVTENGSAWPDHPTVTGETQDTERFGLVHVDYPPSGAP